MTRILLILFALVVSLHADDSILLPRVIELEKRIAELEAKLAPVLEEERVKQIVVEQKERARERMLLDAEFHSRLDLNIIEKAYHTANQDWKSEEAKKAVAFLVEKFPRANRTGCAVLSLAQATEGNEQIDLLRQAIDTYRGCYYANGVQVGAYARLYLGMRLKKDGKDKAAEKFFEQLRITHPNAVDHKGQLLITHLKGME